MKMKWRVMVRYLDRDGREQTHYDERLIEAGSDLMAIYQFLDRYSETHLNEGFVVELNWAKLINISAAPVYSEGE